MCTPKIGILRGYRVYFTCSTRVLRTIWSGLVTSPLFKTLVRKCSLQQSGVRGGLQNLDGRDLVSVFDLQVLWPQRHRLPLRAWTLVDEERAIAHRPLESIERETLVAEGETGFVAERLQHDEGLCGLINPFTMDSGSVSA